MSNNFCSKCGKPIENGQPCNCTKKSTAIPQQPNYERPQFPPNFQQENASPYQQNAFTPTKSKTALILIALFFGCIGGHYFYLGNIRKAISTFIWSALTCGFYGMISGIITIVKVCSGSIQTDVNGVIIK